MSNTSIDNVIIFIVTSLILPCSLLDPRARFVFKQISLNCRTLDIKARGAHTTKQLLGKK